MAPFVIRNGVAFKIHAQKQTFTSFSVHIIHDILLKVMFYNLITWLTLRPNDFSRLQGTQHWELMEFPIQHKDILTPKLIKKRLTHDLSSTNVLLCRTNELLTLRKTNANS